MFPSCSTMLVKGGIGNWNRSDFQKSTRFGCDAFGPEPIWSPDFRSPTFCHPGQTIPIKLIPIWFQLCADFSTQKFCCVEFTFQFYDKMVRKNVWKWLTCTYLPVISGTNFNHCECVLWVCAVVSASTGLRRGKITWGFPVVSLFFDGPTWKP